MPLKRAFWTAVVALPVGAALASVIAFGSVWFCIYFVPVFALVLIQQPYDQAKSFRDSLLLQSGSENDT